MRTKSDAKRQVIMDVAAQTFRELGFERTSMSEICARVGGSKATLYNHFSSKEELFFQVMFQESESEFEAIHACLDSTSESVAEVLREFGKRLLRLIYSPEVLPIRRLVVAESGRSGLGSLVYEKGPKRNHALLTEYLVVAMSQGKLRTADASVAAWHLQGLLQAELHERLLLCTEEVLSEDDIQVYTQRAIDVFMLAYGPRPSKESS
jgi:AcrR family transcriptional regulator